MRAARSSSPLLVLALVVVSSVLTGCSNDAKTDTVTNGAANTTANAATNTVANNDVNVATSANLAENASNSANASNAANTTKPPADDPPKPAGEKVLIKTTKPGTGAGAKDGDLLAMSYSGRLTNGTQFDSNVGSDPLNLTLGAHSVIEGWEEGLQGIKQGEKRTLTIPASKGYGERGSGEKIPPNSVLVFDIECLDLVPSEKADTVERETLRAGTGAAIRKGQTVSFHWRGLLVGGKEFDSSYPSKKPISAKLGSGTLNPPSLEDALVGLRLGGKYKIKFPPVFASGMQGSLGRSVPPNSVIFIEIEPLTAK